MWECGATVGGRVGGPRNNSSSALGTETPVEVVTSEVRHIYIWTDPCYGEDRKEGGSKPPLTPHHPVKKVVGVSSSCGGGGEGVGGVWAEWAGVPCVP